MRILVTGAGGFVGRRLCRELKADGHEVRGLIRSPSSRQLEGIEYTFGDITDEMAVASAADKMDAVVHLAARVHIMREVIADPLAEFREVNVRGTCLLRDAAAKAGVHRFIFASSVKAVGETNNIAWTRSTPPRPEDPYGTSKLEAEQSLAGPAGDHINAVSLRLPLMYGPGVRGNMLRLFNLISRGIPIPVSRIPNARSILYVGNATAAIRHVLAAPIDSLTPIGRIPLFVSDGLSLSTETLAYNIGEALHRRARIIRMPTFMLRGAAAAADRALAAISISPRFNAAIDRLVGSLTTDNKEFENIFGFKPPFTTQAGLDDTARWFLSTTSDR